LAVKTKSIYEPPSPQDGVRILVTRFYPRGVKKGRFDRWDKRLSPSRELVLSYKAGRIGWKKFSLSFLREMKSQDSATAIEDLMSLSKHGDVTLLCYEKEGENCHRQLLKRLVAKKAKPRRRPKASRRIRFYPRKKSGHKASK
jgi:uncharacterized protein YeaO (DUF488 family)